MARSPEYATWVRIRLRCNDPQHADYPDYGGRGIRVCEEWDHPGGFDCFIADMGPRPSPKHSIERRDNSGPYAAWNCRWATNAEQARNKRSSHFIEHNGERLVLTDWAKRLGVPATTLRRRVARGEPIDKQLAQPRKT